MCGKPYAESHEIFGAANRNKSIEYGLQVHLCKEHHTGTDGVHGKNGRKLAEQLHIFGQTVFEKYGRTTEDFVKLFGRNYLGL